MLFDVDIKTVELFSALLTLVVLAGALGVGVLAVLGRSNPAARHLLITVGGIGAWLGFVVTFGATVASLYISEVIGDKPCTLCWYQRIAIYPLVVVCGVAALRRDAAVRFTVWPLAAIGASISTWHYIHERLPDSVGASCDAVAPCSILWIWKLHYISIPMMAFTTMALVATLVSMAPRAATTDTTTADHTTPETL